jgi:predicted extracellular nuclease
VLNYFTTLDDSGPICGPNADQGCRGADNASEFERQKSKLVSALTTLDADIAGLIELENAAGDTPIADLVDGMNAVAGPGTYAYLSTGAIGDDAIRQGLIYKPATVTAVGGFEILDSSIDPAFRDDFNRPVLAQTFEENTSGERFTIAVNHLKSKGSPCNDAVPPDPDTGDGQGNCNMVRTDAAMALVDWLATDPTGSGDPDFLIVGDLNAYAMEDPVMVIEGGGYADLIKVFVGTGFADGAYSFNFFSQSGYLDHALSNAAMTPEVSGAALWHINSDEPRGLDYNDFNQPGLFNPDQFRSSDHDAVVLGFLLDEDEDGVWDPIDVCPGTVIPEGVPTKALGINRFALVDDDGIFDTASPEGEGPQMTFDIFDTAGCSCEQIIEAQELGEGHRKHGCSIGEMQEWVDLVSQP